MVDKNKLLSFKEDAPTVKLESDLAKRKEKRDDIQVCK